MVEMNLSDLKLCLLLRSNCLQERVFTLSRRISLVVQNADSEVLSPGLVTPRTWPGNCCLMHSPGVCDTDGSRYTLRNTSHLRENSSSPLWEPGLTFASLFSLCSLESLVNSWAMPKKLGASWPLTVMGLEYHTGLCLEFRKLLMWPR